MGPIRRTFSLICALLLIAVCVAVLVWVFAYANSFRFVVPVSAGVGLFIGLWWLYTDFINATPKN
jgi:hypothetical protein